MTATTTQRLRAGEGETLTEQALFLIEREIGLKLEDIYRFEAELRKAEIERYEQKK